MNRKEKLLQEFKLRRLIRKAIKIKNVKQKKQEQQLREAIRFLIKEGDVDSDTKPAPYASTAVNALADAFNQILPVIKGGLRKLAKPEERKSYRAHVLQKFESIFANFEGLDTGGKIGESDLNEQEEDNKLKITIDDPDRVMPSDGKEDSRFQEPEKDPEKDLEDKFDTFKMAGENPTGARVAFETINDSNIEQVLSDKRKVLFDPAYKKEFKEYALYNVDLWMLTYEKELADSLGQQPAFTETVMQRPAGAEVRSDAQQFDNAESETLGVEGDETDSQDLDMGEFEQELTQLLMMENDYVGE